MAQSIQVNGHTLFRGTNNLQQWTLQRPFNLQIVTVTNVAYSSLGYKKINVWPPSKRQYELCVLHVYT